MQVSVFFKTCYRCQFSAQFETRRPLSTQKNQCETDARQLEEDFRQDLGQEAHLLRQELVMTKNSLWQYYSVTSLTTATPLWLRQVGINPASLTLSVCSLWSSGSVLQGSASHFSFLHWQVQFQPCCMSCVCVSYASAHRHEYMWSPYSSLVRGEGGVSLWYL